MRGTALCLGLILLTSCTIANKKGILVDVEPGTPMDESDLRQHCDLDDAAACELAGLREMPLPPPSLPLIQGLAPSDRAVFAALVPKEAKFSWFVYDHDLRRLTKLFTVLPVSRGDSHWAVQRIDVQGLLPNRTYELLAGDPDGRMLDVRNFHSFASDEKVLRVSLLGGWRLATPTERTRLLDQALASKPQLLIFAGSSVDATLPPELAGVRGKRAADYFFARHAEARAKLELALHRDLLPVVPLWNDDEFGQADGDRSFPQRDQALEQLKLFFPRFADETSIVSGPGIGLDLKLRHAELALVDDLSFRRAPTEGEPDCHVPKGKRKEVCRPGKRVPAPAGTRYGGIERDWVSDRAAKAEQALWILAGGPNLFRFSDTWTENANLNSPSLTHAPNAPWIATIEGAPAGVLRLSEPGAP